MRIFLLLLSLFFLGGCSTFRKMFDETPEETARRRKAREDAWFTPKPAPGLMLESELNATERREIEAMRAIELKDRTDEMERDRKKRKDWVFSR